MVYTGSIGLHNVLASLRKHGYANPPTNDMQIVLLSPLALADAIHLATRLLDGEGIDTDLEGKAAKIIAEEVDCVPYYIHHVVDQMTPQKVSATPEGIRSLIQDCICNGQDVWSLRHYLDRIDAYYDVEDRPLILATLDSLAMQEVAISFDELFNLTKSQVETEDREQALHCLRLLTQDHYIARDSKGLYRFTYNLVRRWWKLHRGL